jgi:hypothetical protein
MQHDEVVWSDLLSDRIQSSSGVADYLLDLAAKLLPGEVAFGRFHAWESEE